ncbi:toll/interleukin-1 receptor domain-containing protein [Kitasatospora sp. NPDC004531]
MERRRVFISYSRRNENDRALAAQIEDGLHHLARRRLGRLSSVAVFRDSTGLGANSDLPGELMKHLAAADHLIYLASPTAAASPWVARELAFWRRHKSVDTLLIALADGDIAWNPQAADFDWTRTTALPGVLSGAFRDVPFWVDLRAVRPSARRPMAVGSPFRDRVVSLAAPVHGIGKADLDSRDLRLQRRRTRSLQCLVTFLTLALVGSGVAGFIAVRQCNLARTRLAAFPRPSR